MVAMESHTFSVAIVGAGIAGLALSMGLQKLNIPFTMYDEAPQYSTVGAGIGFGPNGLAAMDLIEAKFREKYEAICVGNKFSKDEHVFFEGLLCQEGLGLDQSWYGHSSWGSPGYRRKSAHRKELLDILTSFIPKERVQFNKKLIDVENERDKVILRFADRSSAQASILVGADGVASVVREHVLQHEPHGQVRPVYADSYAYRAVIPMSEAKEILGDHTDTAKMYMGNARSVITYRVSGGEEFNFLHCVYENGKGWSSSEGVTQEVSLAEMLADFQGRGVDVRLLKLLEKARPIRWGLFHHLQTSTYIRNRAVLLGDSAHASLPYQAAGAGQGVEDAAVLSSVLGSVVAGAESGQQGSRLRAAFEAYDAVRRPRAQRQVEQSLDAGLLISFQHPEAGSNMEKILKRLQGDRFDWLWFHDIGGDIRRALEMMNESIGCGH